jgi:cytochrome c peroxidase
MRNGWLLRATQQLRSIALVGSVCVLGSLVAGLASQPAAEQRPGKQTLVGLPPYSNLTGATPAQIQLGKKLFFDRRLSVNNTLSCGMCHIEGQAFASTQTSLSVGMEGRSLRRNAPSLFNVVFQQTLFHDGRETELANQVWLPLLLSDEMANPSVGSVINRIRSLPDYEGAFERAFDGAGPSMQTIGDAIAAYERTLLSANSRFDKWHFGHEENALIPY